MKKLLTGVLSVLFAAVTVLPCRGAAAYDYFTVKPNEEAARINSCIALINDIGEVSYFTRAAVYSARRACDALSAEELRYVVNYEEYTAAVAELNKIGDLDGSGRRDAPDAVLLSRELLEGGESENTDINGDNSVDILDLIALKKLMSGC